MNRQSSAASSNKETDYEYESDYEYIVEDDEDELIRSSIRRRRRKEVRFFRWKETPRIGVSASFHLHQQ